MIDLHFLADGLAVGARFPMQAAARLAGEHKITRVVDVRVEACDDAAVLALHGICLLHLPTHDTCAISQRMIREGVSFVCRALERGERVLVHCQYGIGRSALLALCVLVARGRAPLEALALAKDARPVVSPSPEQLEAFIEFCERHRGDAGAPWSVPTFHELAEIAYRDLDGRASREAARAASTRAG
ncbi:dual specificity protein phosphatase family protein [Anaeromyxobacter sp. Fw109-5]|uniref:protein-tyrosine phosphatase family protein n=1 Tax=Anaeromyxobacter sp. (strain Fw109-5) TaxID=404589 RepID=UPI0000ED8BA3|nr:dual specificity protein phosphatase [Anaeromyxobacter sp. Fw109-5]ABS26336.1 dual specificity protein phosphatase [Anaeromyxobacter sp. Fw109-5]